MRNDFLRENRITPSITKRTISMSNTPKQFSEDRSSVSALSLQGRRFRAAQILANFNLRNQIEWIYSREKRKKFPSPVRENSSLAIAAFVSSDSLNVVLAKLFCLFLLYLICNYHDNQTTAIVIFKNINMLRSSFTTRQVQISNFQTFLKLLPTFFSRSD